MPFLNIILIPLNSATRMCYADLEMLLLLYNPVIIKNHQSANYERNLPPQELTITHKSLGLCWKGVTLNNLKRLLLKTLMSEFRI